MVGDEGTASTRAQAARIDGALSEAEQDLILPSTEEHDLDLFRDRLNAAYYPAFVDVVGSKPKLDHGRLNAAKLGRVTVGFVRFGHQAVVDPGVIDGFHVNVPVAGAIGSRCGDQSVLARPGTAAVFTPNGPTKLPFWSTDAAQLCLKISREALESELEGLLGRPVPGRLEFGMALDLGTPNGRQWHRALWNLVDSVSMGGLPGAVSDYLERAVICQLLFAADHGLGEDVRGGRSAPLPGAVRRVVELIEGAPEVLLTAADLARHAGVGVRRLEQGFRESLGTTPTAYHQKVRLERARADLLQPAAGETVTSVMYRWGFSNHARFAANYRARFGENPAETLRRSLGA